MLFDVCKEGVASYCKLHENELLNLVKGHGLVLMDMKPIQVYTKENHSYI